MLAFHDHTAAIDEPKTARMEQRTKPHIKAAIHDAAALLGVDETTFVTSAAYDRARAAIREFETTVLTPADRDVFLSALDAPAKPSNALREAASLHKSQIRNGA